MTKQQTFMTTRRFEFPLTYLTTGVRYQPWVQCWILHFSTITVIPTGSFRPFVFKPTFWTTTREKGGEKKSNFFKNFFKRKAVFTIFKIVTRLPINIFTTTVTNNNLIKFIIYNKGLAICQISQYIH